MLKSESEGLPWGRSVLLIAMVAIELDFVSALAEKLDAPIAGLRLLVSLLAGYPLAFIYRKYFHGKSVNSQHTYFLVCGFILGYFNYGHNIFHSLFCITFVYFVLFFLGGTFVSVLISFVFTLGYLFCAYIYYSTSTYDINWTTGHCVLTLRLIGLAFDYKDGQKPEEQRSSDQKLAALEKLPSFLAILGNCYFFGGSLVGPQFTTKRYMNLVDGTYSSKSGEAPNSVSYAMQRLAGSLVCLIIYQLLAPYFPNSIIYTDALLDIPYWRRLLMWGVWARVVLYKYLACWLMSEGVCVLTGLSYNGLDADKNVQWNGCTNICYSKYEFRTSFQSLIDSFNVSTNQWALCYLYKRLKFMNNKFISQFGTLVFLAVWHGYYSGYYHAFALEFIVMYHEKELTSLVEKNPTLKRLAYQTPSLRPFIVVLMMLFNFVMTGYCFCSFSCLLLERYWKAFANIYFIGHIIYCGWPIYAIPLRILFPRKKENIGDGQHNNSSTSENAGSTEKKQD